MSPCPSPETLGRLTDASSDLRFAAMEAHVDACPDCQHVVERLAAQTDVTGGRGGRRSTEEERPPTIPGFVIERELGRGGMGVVYQAWQPHLRRRVAIKVVSTRIGIGAKDRRRWLREAQAVGRVRHRNVVQLHEAGEHGGCLYLVLDLVTGGSLAERVTGPLPARLAVDLMMAVARAVDQIHQAGVLHLDIKPSNILLDGPPDGPWDQATPMIADFGVAHTVDSASATATGQLGMPGTPSFMAPEQIAGDLAAIGPQTDVFALGATLYSLLTGRPPFQGASAIETLDLVRTSDPAPPRALVPGIPRELETIALTCLRKDPRHRYASAQSLAADLKRWRDGFPIHARPVSRLVHASQWCRRRPALASLLAVLAFTVASSLVGFFSLWRHSEAERHRAERALARAVKSDQAMTGAVRDLVGLLRSTVESPQVLAKDRIDSCMRIVDDLTMKIRREGEIDDASVVAVCELACKVSMQYRRRHARPEIVPIFLKILAMLDGRRGRGVTSTRIEAAYGRALTEVADIAREERRLDDALAYLNRAQETVEGIAHDPARLPVVISIDLERSKIAEVLSELGQMDRWRGLMETHIRMLDRLNRSGAADPGIGLLAALARAELAPDASAMAAIRTAIAQFPANARMEERLELRLADSIAAVIAAFAYGPIAGAAPEFRLDPDAHADVSINALESRCKLFGCGAGHLRAGGLSHR